MFLLLTWNKRTSTRCNWWISTKCRWRTSFNNSRQWFNCTNSKKYSHLCSYYYYYYYCFLLPTNKCAASNIRCHWKVLGSLFGVLAVLALVSIGFSAYINYNASHHSELEKNVLVYRHTTISLLDHLLPFYLSKIDVIETNSNLNTDILFIDEACTSLNRKKKLQPLNGINQKDIPSFTGLYLLPDSFLHLNICAVTSSNYKKC